MRKLLLASALILPLLGMSIGHADAPIQGTMQAFVVEVEGEKESLKTADNVKPDELVEYQLTYVNKGTENINGLTVVGPVPEGTSYVSDTANADVAASLLVSIDGGKTFESEPVVRVETKSSGEVVEKVIPPTEYTHLKWQVEKAIEADGGKQFYTYRVRVK